MPGRNNFGYFNVHDSGSSGAIVLIGGPVVRTVDETSPLSCRSFLRFVYRREFQSTCLVFRSPTNRIGNPPRKQVDRSDPFNGLEGKSKPQEFSPVCQQHNFNNLQVGQAGKGYCVVDYTTADMAVPPSATSLSVQWQT